MLLDSLALGGGSSLQAELGVVLISLILLHARRWDPVFLSEKWQDSRRAAWERSVLAGAPSNLKPMPCEAQNLLHGGSHAVQCRGILSLIDTSRAGRTTLEVHLRSCELSGMQDRRALHISKSDWLMCISSQFCARPEGTDWFGGRLGPVRSGATWRLREHGDPENKVGGSRAGTRAAAGLTGRGAPSDFE